MIELLQQLTPIYGPLSALLIVAIVCLVVYIRQKDSKISDKDLEIERLRNERNTAVEKKDVDVKDAYGVVIDLQEKSIMQGANLEKAINKLGEESRIRAESEKLKTDSIVKTLEGIQTVLISIKK